jgi:single-strand DNA-binding protein
MASFNKVILIGRLTADPELKQTQSGVPVTTFKIAVDRKYSAGEEKQTDFHTIQAWRNTAEFICKHFPKGSAILLVGELQNRTWTDQQGQKRYVTEVVASEVNFCEPKRDSETNSTPRQLNTAPAQNSGAYMPSAYNNPQFDEIKTDDDLPF